MSYPKLLSTETRIPGVVKGQMVPFLKVFLSLLALFTQCSSLQTFMRKYFCHFLVMYFHFPVTGSARWQCLANPDSAADWDPSGPDLSNCQSKWVSNVTMLVCTITVKCSVWGTFLYHLSFPIDRNLSLMSKKSYLI